MNEIAKEIRVVFPIHPRTLERVERYKLIDMVDYMENVSEYKTLENNKKVLAISPLGYIDILNLMSHAALVLTDSGGIQEETTILGIPCLTL